MAIDREFIASNCQSERIEGVMSENERKVFSKSMSERELVRIVWPNKTLDFLSGLLGLPISTLRNKLYKEGRVKIFPSLSPQRRKQLCEEGFAQLERQWAKDDEAWAELEKLSTLADQEIESGKAKQIHKCQDRKDPGENGYCPA